MNSIVAMQQANLLMIFVGLAINISLCFAVATLFNRKGHSYAGGFWLSFFLSPIVGLIWGLCISDVSNIVN